MPKNANQVPIRFTSFGAFTSQGPHAWNSHVVSDLIVHMYDVLCMLVTAGGLWLEPRVLAQGRWTLVCHVTECTAGSRRDASWHESAIRHRGISSPSKEQAEKRLEIIQYTTTAACCCFVYCTLLCC